MTFNRCATESVLAFEQPQGSLQALTGDKKKKNPRLTRYACGRQVYRQICVWGETRRKRVPQAKKLIGRPRGILTSPSQVPWCSTCWAWTGQNSLGNNGVGLGDWKSEASATDESKQLHCLPLCGTRAMMIVSSKKQHRGGSASRNPSADPSKTVAF